jgi:hypothetical protein
MFGVVHEEEVSINQIFGKMTEILQTVTERREPRGEDEIVECFLKFQPRIFVGEVEQDRPQGHRRVGKPGVMWGANLRPTRDRFPGSHPWSSPPGLYLLVHIPRFTTHLVKGPLIQVEGFAFGTSPYPRGRTRSERRGLA